jgi:hypothetical protein
MKPWKQTMRNLMRNLFAALLVALTLVSCQKNEVDGIIIGHNLLENQSFSDNRELVSLIRQTLNKDEKALAALTEYWCGGASGCYDLGFIVTQIIYRLGEDEFSKMVYKLNDKETEALEGLIAVGLEYYDNDKDGKMDEKRIENEFPNLYNVLR